MLYFTVGCARSGKSTLANKWVRGAVSIVDHAFVPVGVTSDTPRVVVCGDDFRLAIHGALWNSRTEGFVYAAYYAAIRAHLLRGCDVLVDETNTSEPSLRRLFHIDPGAHWVLVPTSEAVCRERAILTKQEYLVPVIARHRKNIDGMLAEGLDVVMGRVRDYVLDPQYGKSLPW